MGSNWFIIGVLALVEFGVGRHHGGFREPY
jgi:hypothetical protein